MSVGIVAVIPLVFTPPERFGLEERHFSRGFFDNYNVEETGKQKIFTIKEDILIKNYKPFLTEFYGLIEEDFYKQTKLTVDDIPVAHNLDDFLEVFDGQTRGNRAPFLYDRSSMFSVLGCECSLYWIFYGGGYNAYLEIYSTLLHFEKTLAKAMVNPLAKSVKFGLFG